MSKLNELIDRLCPNGVPYKKLGDFCSIQTGRGITNKNTSDDGKYPVISGGVQNMGFYHEYNREAKTVTIARAGSAGYVNYIPTRFYLNDKCFSVIPKDKTNTRYLYHALKRVEKDIIGMKSTGSVPTINTEKVSSVKIPVPPIEVQCEIVRILDSFTELTTELTTELSARRKQYEYYRDWLFENIDFKYKVKLGSFVQILRGGNFQKADFVEQGKPCIHYGQIYTHFGIHTDTVLKFLPDSIFHISKKANPGDIVMAVTSENVEDVCKCVAWIGNEQIAVSGHTAIIQHNQNPKYLSHFFHSSMFFNQKIKYAHGTKVIEIKPSSLVNIEIPLPSLNEQQKIVDILESFNSLTMNISEGIPSEINRRTLQYEYYRDILLTFKELKV